MVIQTIPRGSMGYEKAGEIWANAAGNVMGNLIGSKLAGLGQRHQQQETTRAYMDAGIPAEQAQALSRLPQQQQQAYFQHALDTGQLGGQPIQPQQQTSLA